MNATISVYALGFILIGIAVLILFIYCILLIKSLIPSAKKLDQILENVQSITATASKNTQSVQEIITSLSGSADNISKVIKGNQSSMAAITTLINAIASFKNLMSRNERKD